MVRQEILRSGKEGDYYNRKREKKRKEKKNRKGRKMKKERKKKPKSKRKGTGKEKESFSVCCTYARATQRRPCKVVAQIVTITRKQIKCCTLRNIYLFTRFVSRPHFFLVLFSAKF